jgi:hypothetical protein
MKMAKSNHRRNGFPNGNGQNRKHSYRNGTRGNSRKGLEIFLFGLTSACLILCPFLARGC